MILSSDDFKNIFLAGLYRMKNYSIKIISYLRNYYMRYLSGLYVFS